MLKEREVSSRFTTNEDKKHGSNL